MNHRVAQIESTLRRAMADVLQTQLSDPRIQGLVSVTCIKVAEDLKSALVKVSVLPESCQSKTLYGLRHAAGHIHRSICRRVSLAHVPRFDFRLDRSIKQQAGVEQAIKQAMERTGKQTALPDDSKKDLSH